MNHNATSGRTRFLQDYTPEMMETIMREVVPGWDVEIEETMWPLKIGAYYDDLLTYIYKIKDGRHIYFFANLSDNAIRPPHFVSLEKP